MTQAIPIYILEGCHRKILHRHAEMPFANLMQTDIYIWISSSRNKSSVTELVKQNILESLFKHLKTDKW